MKIGMRMTPCDYAISVFGCINRVAVALDIEESAVRAWRLPRVRGEAGDIPVWNIRRLLEVARERCLSLSEHDLIFGRDLPEAMPLGSIG